MPQTPTAPIVTGAEPDALRELLDRGFRYACSLTHDEATAEDILQDAWVSLLRAGSAREPGYLFRAIRSRFIDRYRRNRLVVMTGLDEVAGHADDGVDNTAQIVAGDMLARALGTLRAEEREALFLSAVEGYSGGEISELTGRTVSAVRTMLHRVRGKLRAYIRRHDKKVSA